MTIIIDLIHLLIILFITLIPFIKTDKNNIKFKYLYIFLIPIMWLHWYLCFGHCALTVFDNWINGRDLFSGDGFIYRALTDIFLITKSNYCLINYMIWIISISLWLKVVYDIYINFCKKKLSITKIL